MIVTEKDKSILRQLMGEDNHISIIINPFGKTIQIEVDGNTHKLHASTFKSLDRKCLISGLRMAMDGCIEVWHYKINVMGKQEIGL